MKLGIMSDSHGQAARVGRALALLRDHGAEAVIHCGDVGGPDVLDEFAGWRGWFVWGNTDFPEPAWRAQVEALDLPWPNGPLELELAGRHLAIFHGHEPQMRGAITAKAHDYLLHGHTHRREDRRLGGMRVINPGALHRAVRKTVALLDLTRDDLAFLDVPADGNK